jgi:hypothetical protein
MPRRLRATVFGFLIPAAVYAAVYYLFSYPLWHQFSSHFFCGDEDGYQNIWNLWWVNKCVWELKQLPWHTTWLHHPDGATLIAHTLAPFNGLLGAPLQKAGLTLAQTYNTIVIFSFVMTGVTTFWLARRLTGSYAGSLFAGAAFTFSHFHFAHAQNHLQMVTLEWLPLAVLAVYELFTRPTALKGAAAAAAMGLVALSDFHLTFYVVIAGCLLGVITLARLIRGGFVDARTYILPLGVFVTLTVGSTGLLAYELLRVNKADELQHNHDPREWSTDVIDPLIPSAQWRWSEWTRPAWGALAPPDKPWYYVEHSLYVGWVVALLCGWAAWRWRVPRVEGLGYWFGLMALFFVLSLGPKLHVWGNVTEVPGVYPVLERVFPPLKMGGVPMRMMIMVFLAGAVIAAGALGDVVRVTGRAAWVVVPILIAAWTFESLPKPQPTTPAGYPQWVTKLRDLPPGAVIDTFYKSHLSLPLYHVTGHGKPMGEGYISRYPKSVEQKRGEFRHLVETQDWQTLREKWKFRYLVTKERVPLKELFADGEVRVYSLE